MDAFLDFDILPVFNLERAIAPLTPYQSNWRKVEVRWGRIGAVRILRGTKICNDFPLIFDLFPYFNKKKSCFYTMLALKFNIPERKKSITRRKQLDSRLCFCAATYNLLEHR